MKKHVLMITSVLLIGILCVMPIVTQESTETVYPTDIEWVCPQGYSGQTLVLYNWLYYIGDSVIKEFEVRCDVTIRLDIGSNKTINSMRQGNVGYDIAFPNDYAISVLVKN